MGASRLLLVPINSSLYPDLSVWVKINSTKKPNHRCRKHNLKKLLALIIINGVWIWTCPSRSINTRGQKNVWPLPSYCWHQTTVLLGTGLVCPDPNKKIRQLWI